MKTTGKVASLIGILCLMTVSPGNSAAYYVSPNGNDDNTGTSPATAWRTIQRSVGSAAPGDTIIIADGIYREMVRFDGLAKGEQPVTYRAQNPARAIIDAEGAMYCLGADWDTMRKLVLVGLKLQNGKMGLGFEPGGSGLVFSNCEISGCREAIRVSTGAFLSILDCSAHDDANNIIIGRKDVSGVRGVLIERCTMGPTPEGNRDGIVIEGMATDVVIRDCVASGAGDSGFDIKPSGALLERCRSYGNRSWGFKLWGSGCKVINCVTYDNGAGAMGCAGDNLQFWNCTLGPGGSGGLRLETPNVASCVIRNTIFYGSVLHCYAPGLPDEDYNCYYSSDDEIIRTANRAYKMSDIGRAKGPGAHDLAANPLFRNPKTGDYQLTKGSPCLNAGRFDPLVAVDHHRKPRSDPPDLGAIASP